MSRIDQIPTILNENQTGVFGFISDGNKIFVRSHDGLLALDALSGEVIWEVKFEGDNIFGFKSIYLDDNKNIIVSLSDNENKSHLQSIDSKTGNKVWSIPIGWNVHNNYGGALIKEDRIYFIEKGEGFKIRCISSMDGSEIMKNESLELKPSGKFQSKNRTAYLVKDNIYALGKSHVIRINLKDLSYSILDDFECNQFFANENYLVRIIENGKAVLISSIDVVDKVISRVELPSVGEAFLNYFKYKDQEYIIARYTESFQFFLINIQKAEIATQIELHDFPFDCIHVEGNIVILSYTDESNPIILFDLEEDSIVSNIDKGLIRGGLYNYEDGFVFASMNGLEMYTSEK